jgi:hypothetical protein
VLSLNRTISTTPFAGSTTSTKDAEGTAYVLRDRSLWLVGDNGRSAYEIDPVTGALKRIVGRTAFEAAPLLGGGPVAGSTRTGDLESLAYDETSDTLYAFSGSCCTSAAQPTVFRLTRDAQSQRLVVDSYQPLGSGIDYTGAAWNPADDRVYVAKGRIFRRYEYETNTVGPQITVQGISGVLGLDFSTSGADLMVVTNAERLYRVVWSTKRIAAGWDLDLTPFGVRDSRAVELISSPSDANADQIYVYDGYDGRPLGDPLRYAVFVFDVTAGDGGGGSQQLVGNPGFESSTSGWIGSGLATLSRVAGGRESAFAARLANDSAGSGNCMLNDSPNTVSSAVATAYTASVWVRADAPGATLRLRLREYAGSQLVGTPAIAAITLTTGWQQVTVTKVPQAAGNMLDLTAYVSDAAPGTCFYADDVSLTTTG